MNPGSPKPLMEVIKSRGLLGTLTNIKAARKDVRQKKQDILKAELAAKKPKENIFYSIEKVKPKYEQREIEGSMRRVMVDPGHYERIGMKPTMGEAGREEVYRERLTPKETKTYLKAKRSTDDEKYRPWFEMRKALKESKPYFKGPGTTKRMKKMWKEQSGDKAFGVKNKIKLAYGFGKQPDMLAKAFSAEYQANKSGGGIVGPGPTPGAGSNQSFCTAKGICRQVNPD